MDMHLTKRQAEILQLIAEGLTDRQIAERLVISPRTASGHVHSAMQALGATTRAQAVYLHFVGNGAGEKPKGVAGCGVRPCAKNRASRR